ncbi:MAG: hypothetical protein JW973_15220 [Bacteroidales bacterium]|nr:hypothetical protein [Bacteroidales bacterium]
MRLVITVLCGKNFFRFIIRKSKDWITFMPLFSVKSKYEDGMVLKLLNPG